MRVFLERKNIYLSNPTIHKYMNKELGLYSIVKRKKPRYRKGKAHKVFANLLKQDFTATSINEKWCTDFTYLFLTDGSKRYNCSILDLYDRSIVASLNGTEITAELAINTVKKAIASHPTRKGSPILHSDQGSQFTSKVFVDFCKSMKITQSMSKAFSTAKGNLGDIGMLHTDRGSEFKNGIISVRKRVDNPIFFFQQN